MARKTQLELLREAERKLAADLADLRRKIKAAERGENSRIKDAGRYIARVTRNIQRTAREQEKIREKELAKLEKFLGESFDSLAEARKALSTQTRKATKRELLAESIKLKDEATRAKTESTKRRKLQQAESFEKQATGRKLNPSKQSYTIRQLSAAEKTRVLDLLQDRPTFRGMGKGYLLPNERVTVSVPYKYYDTDGKIHVTRAVGRKVFDNWDALVGYFYSKYFDQGGDEFDEDWLSNIEVIKFPTAYQYNVERGKQSDEKRARKKRVGKFVREKIKQEKEKARQSERAKAAKKIAAKQKQIDKLKGSKAK